MRVERRALSQHHDPSGQQHEHHLVALLNHRDPVGLPTAVSFPASRERISGHPTEGLVWFRTGPRGELLRT